MNDFRRPKSIIFLTNRKDRPSRIAELDGVVMSMISLVILIAMITCAESFVVRGGKSDYQRYCETTYWRQKQEYCTPYGSYSLPILRSSSSSLSSSKDSEFSSNASIDHANAAVNASLSNTNTVVAGDGSKMEQRKRYDGELEDAFAQQTRERNPLLGVKSIGVDYGLVRTGVAVTIGYNPEALDVIVTDHPLLFDDEKEGMLEEDVEKEEERRLDVQRAKVTERVIEIASRENADRIVVGLPLHKNGTEAPQSLLARKFARDHLVIAALRNLGPGVSIYMCDERYTSKEAAARIRTSQNNNDNLYGLLDAESAKIILEQYYDDHLDRYNTNTRNLGNSDDKTKTVDPGYNGELVSISDADLVEDLTLEYNEMRRLKRERLASERNDREARVKQRKIEMEKYRMQQEENAANGIVTSKKKKKKKKRKNRQFSSSWRCCSLGSCGKS